VSPICQAREHDSVLLYCLKSKRDDISADPPATEVVNAAIELFAVSLPLQGPKIQESTLEQMATLLSVNSLQRNPARKAAMTVNLAVALLNTLKVAVRETQFAPGDLRSTSTEKIIQELLRVSTPHLPRDEANSTAVEIYHRSRPHCPKHCR
jgi:HEAT repeat-containing protein 5